MMALFFNQPSRLNTQKRILTLALLICVAATALGFRLFKIQLLDGNGYGRAALRQRTQGVAWGFARGDFLDAKGQPLTGRGGVWKAVLFPNTEGFGKLTVPILSGLADVNAAWLQTAIAEGRPIKMPYAFDDASRLALENMRLPGLVFAEEPRRYGEPLAVHVIGYLAGDAGIAGLEYQLDAELSGKGSSRLAATVDAAARPISGLGIRHQEAAPDNAGWDVVLTIDRDLQEIVEHAMDVKGIRGAIVAVDPRNGDVLAMASRPQFDPENAGLYLQSEHAPFINRAISAYFPGSVFKIAIAVAALENGICAPESRFVDSGSIDIGHHQFHCHRKEGHGELSFSDAFAESCNTVFVAVGQTLGARAIVATAEKLGIGKLTNIGLRDENAGSLPVGWPLLPADIANLTLGQKGVSATPLQVALMASAIANGGILHVPRLVAELRTNDGVVVRTFTPDAGQRVMKPSTAQKMQQMMRQCVSQGTGMAAAGIEGGSAGKTGTAETGRTTPEDMPINNAWFVGFAPGTPGQEPSLCMAILIEDGQSGSVTAAPLFAEILAAFVALKE